MRAALCIHTPTGGAVDHVQAHIYDTSREKLEGLHLCGDESPCARAARMGDKRMRNCVYACGGIREQSKAYAAKRMRGVNVELRQVDDDESDSEV